MQPAGGAYKFGYVQEMIQERAIVFTMEQSNETTYALSNRYIPDDPE